MIKYFLKYEMTQDEILLLQGAINGFYGPVRQLDKATFSDFFAKSNTLLKIYNIFLDFKVKSYAQGN